MKKVRNILVTFLIIIAVFISTIVYWQYDNISALINGVNSSTEDLAQKMDENRANLKVEVERYISEPIADITAEDEQKLLKGEVTVEEIADKYNLPLEYMKDSDTENNESNNTPVEKNDFPDNSENKQTDTKEIDKAISEGVSKMYALKAKYVNKLGELEREVIKEYSSLPKEQQNKDGKYKMLMDNLDYVAKLEKKCDNEVAKVLDDLESELKKLNGDTEIIKILRDAYKQEKEIKKSYYLSLYNK